MNDADDREERDIEVVAQAALARDILARDRRHVWHPFTQHGTESEPLLIAGARGASLYDAEGSEILDLISSWWTCTHGHSHPKLNEALAQQAGRFDHVMFAGFTHQPAVDLASALAQLLPGDLSRVFFSDDGSTSVEVALKIAYQYWANRGERRRAFVSFDGGYHGDTLGAMSLGRGSGFFNLFRGMMCQVAVLPFPYTYDGDEATEDREMGALTALEDRLWNGTHDVAALIIEPLLQGAGGMRMCRPEFLARLVEMAQSAGVLVIFDEVATGFGRTGTLFAMQQAGVVPDLVCLSKGLTSGYLPMAVTVARDRVFEAFVGETFDRALPHGHSFTANPLACAVALCSLMLFAEEDTLGAHFADRGAAPRDARRASAARRCGSPQGAWLDPRLRSEGRGRISIGGEPGPQGPVPCPRPKYSAARSYRLSDAALLHHRREISRAYAGLIEGLDWLATTRP